MATNLESAEWGMVVFGKPVHFDKYFKNKCIRIINNSRVDMLFGEHGTNEQFEFGAYLDLLTGFKSKGPYVVLNDTLFTLHHTRLWMRLIDGCLGHSKTEGLGPGIIGDIRRDGTDLPERPDPFLASWVFIIPNRNSLASFQTALNTVLGASIPAKFSDGYEDFLNKWLTQKTMVTGWHGTHSDSEILRKRKTIFWEHRLSKLCTESGVELVSIGQYQPVLYAMVRIYDRIINRVQAAKRMWFN